jgi:antitoxin HicB
MSEAWRLNLTPDDNGTFLVTSPTLGEVTSFGEDEEDAKAHGRDALIEAFAARMKAGQDIPGDWVDNPPQKGVSTVFVDIPTLVVLKVDLYRLCRGEGITRADLVRRLDWPRESVDRLFRLDHLSRLDQLEAAAKAVGRRVAVELVAEDA